MKVQERLEIGYQREERPPEALPEVPFAFDLVLVAAVFYRVAIHLIGYREMELDTRQLGARGGACVVVRAWWCVVVRGGAWW